MLYLNLSRQLLVSVSEFRPVVGDVMCKDVMHICILCVEGGYNLIANSYIANDFVQYYLRLIELEGSDLVWDVWVIRI